MMSKYTAFVAVNENNKAVEGNMETRNVNQLTSAPRYPSPLLFLLSSLLFSLSHISLSFR